MPRRRERPEGASASGQATPGKPQTARKHPEEWAGDLNPDLRTAYDVKNLHRQLSEEFTDDELRTIPVIPEGQRLQQGGVYIDLGDPRRREFTATGDMRADARNLYTSKSEVPYPIWNRLMRNGSEVSRSQERKRAANG